jgi:hypothetical protein
MHSKGGKVAGFLVLVQFEAEAFRVQPLGCCFGQASSFDEALLDGCFPPSVE